MRPRPCRGSSRCGPPPLWTALTPPVCCLCWPTPTPCSSFLRTRKRLALLTPSRGLALAGQEKRPPGWAGHRGGRAGREGEDGGVRLRRDRPAAVSVAAWAAEGGEVGRLGDPVPPPRSSGHRRAKVGRVERPAKEDSSRSLISVEIDLYRPRLSPD